MRLTRRSRTGDVTDDARRLRSLTVTTYGRFCGRIRSRSAASDRSSIDDDGLFVPLAAEKSPEYLNLSFKENQIMFASPTQLLNVSIRLLFICLATLICTGAVMAQAQSNASDLQGVVRDPNGAAVKGATVTARNLATNVTRNASTNEDGVYQIVGLPPGNYEITAEASGFSKGRVASITLTVGQRGDLDIPLAVGDVGAVVDISTADVSLVETSKQYGFEHDRSASHQ